MDTYEQQTFGPLTYEELWSEIPAMKYAFVPLEQTPASFDSSRYLRYQYYDIVDLLMAAQFQNPHARAILATTEDSHEKLRRIKTINVPLHIRLKIRRAMRKWQEDIAAFLAGRQTDVSV